MLQLKETNIPVVLWRAAP